MLRNMTVQGLASAYGPHIFFFMFHGTANLTCENCIFEDGCMGQDAVEHFLEGMGLVRHLCMMHGHCSQGCNFCMLL